MGWWKAVLACALIGCAADADPDPEPESGVDTEVADSDPSPGTEGDADGDGVLDADDLCPAGPDDDLDGDGVPDACAVLAECAVSGLSGEPLIETLWCTDEAGWFVGDLWKVELAEPGCVAVAVDRLTLGGGDPWVVVQGPTGGTGGAEQGGALDDAEECSAEAATGACPRGAVRTFLAGEVWILTGLKSGTCIAGQTRVSLQVSVDGQPVTPTKVRDDVELCDPLSDAAFVDDDEDGVLGSCDVCEGDDAAGDHDLDGLCGEADDDDDGDGVLDEDDLCFGDDAVGDFDRDKICDDVDEDDDGDWVPDTDDLCLGWWWVDTDGDGLCNDVDDDDDGDGVLDGDDLCQGDDALGDPDGDGICG